MDRYHVRDHLLLASHYSHVSEKMLLVRKSLNSNSIIITLNRNYDIFTRSYLEHLQSVNSVETFGTAITNTTSTASSKWWKGWLLSLYGGINLMFCGMKGNITGITTSPIATTSRRGSVAAIFHGTRFWYLTISDAISMRWVL